MEWGVSSEWIHINGNMAKQRHWLVSPAGLHVSAAVLTSLIAHDILTDPAFFQKNLGSTTALSLSLFPSFLLQVKQMVPQVTHWAGAGGEKMVVKENIIHTDKYLNKELHDIRKADQFSNTKMWVWKHSLKQK